VEGRGGGRARPCTTVGRCFQQARQSRLPLRTIPAGRPLPRLAHLLPLMRQRVAHVPVLENDLAAGHAARRGRQRAHHRSVHAGQHPQRHHQHPLLGALVPAGSTSGARRGPVPPSRAGASCAWPSLGAAHAARTPWRSAVQLPCCNPPRARSPSALPHLLASSREGPRRPSEAREEGK
jgi:hypothetical protein